MTAIAQCGKSELEADWTAAVVVGWVELVVAVSEGDVDNAEAAAAAEDAEADDIDATTESA